MVWLENEREVQECLTKGILDTKNHGIYDHLIADEYIAYHSVNVARYGLQIGIAAGCTSEELQLLAVGGICHDIGKIKIPPEILYKPDKLTRQEFAIMMRHTEYGYHMLQKAYMPKEVCDIARDHHEKLDGSGYTGFLRPAKLTQIITVADIFSALTEKREYHSPCSIEEAVDILSREKGIRKEYIGLLVTHLSGYASIGNAKSNLSA